MVERGTFRQDLLFRLNVVVLQLPALRERSDDILPLANHFLQLQAARYGEPTKTLDDEAAAARCTYRWPGNVRELANAMERAFVSEAGPVIHVNALPPAVPRCLMQPTAVESELMLEAVERRLISEALRRTHANKAAASRLLGIDVKRLRRRMTRLGIPNQRPRGGADRSIGRSPAGD